MTKLVMLAFVNALSLLAVAQAQVCNQQTKQKSIYTTPKFSPDISSVNAFDIIGDVIWTDLDGLRNTHKNGKYMAFPVGWGPNVPSGYFGTQAIARDKTKGQLLFSLWDHNKNGVWKAAIPTHPNCKRNCNDCAVHTGDSASDGSTGTQCKFHVPVGTGTHFRVRIRRTAEDITVDYNGNLDPSGSFRGDEYTVTVQNVDTAELWVVGSQVLTGVYGGRGINRIATFNEHIGCTLCDAFTQVVTRRGPWVLDPPNTRLVSVSSTYNRDPDKYTCHMHSIEGTQPGEFKTVTGPGAGIANPKTWDKVLFTCSETTGGHCDPPPAVVTAEEETAEEDPCASLKYGECLADATLGCIFANQRCSSGDCALNSNKPWMCKAHARCWYNLNDNICRETSETSGCASLNYNACLADTTLGCIFANKQCSEGDCAVRSDDPWMCNAHARCRYSRRNRVCEKKKTCASLTYKECLADTSMGCIYADSQCSVGDCALSTDPWLCNEHARCKYSYEKDICKAQTIRSRVPRVLRDLRGFIAESSKSSGIP